MLLSPTQTQRISVIQAAINKTRKKRYLEIGVQTGVTFFSLRARKKIAVDPVFSFPKKRMARAILKDSRNLRNQYYEEASDDFFSHHKERYKSNKFDVVFIDGLHTYEQSFRDVLNSLEVLNEEGAIIMHDCNPISEARAYPAKSIDEVEALNLEGYDGGWNGDVWKTIVKLRQTKDYLDIHVTNCLNGLGIIKKRRTPGAPFEFEQDVDELTYSDLDSEREMLLNLIDIKEFTKYI